MNFLIFEFIKRIRNHVRRCGYVATIFCVLPSIVCGSSSRESVGRVVSINGRASSQLGSLLEKTLKIGDNVREGEVIKTETTAGVKLLMNDRSIVDIASNSSFRIKEYRGGATDVGGRKVSMELDFGSIRALVRKRLEQKSNYTIRTRTSVLAVRGTEFSASWREVNGKAEEQVTVSNGTVAVTPSFVEGKTVNLGIGNQLSSTGVVKNNRVVASEGSKGQSSIRVTTIPNSEISRVISASSVEDKTFLRDISVSDNSSDRNGGRGDSTLASIAVSVGAEVRQRGPKNENGSIDNSGKKESRRTSPEGVNESRGIKYDTDGGEVSPKGVPISPGGTGSGAPGFGSVPAGTGTVTPNTDPVSISVKLQ